MRPVGEQSGEKVGRKEGTGFPGKSASDRTIPHLLEFEIKFDWSLKCGRHRVLLGDCDPGSCIQ